MITHETAADPLELELPVTVAFHPDLNPSDVRVYLALSWCHRAGMDRPSHFAIGDLAGITRNTVMNSIANLVDAGVLTVDRSAAPHAYQIVT